MKRTCKECKHIIYGLMDRAYCDKDTDCENVSPDDNACNWFCPNEEEPKDRYYWLSKACDVIRNTKMDDDLRSHLINSIMRL